MSPKSIRQQALVDRLLARACEETGVDYAFAFEASPRGTLMKTFGRTRQRWKVWRKLREYGLTYPEIGMATGVDHSSVMHAARVEGWYVPVHGRGSGVAAASA